MSMSKGTMVNGHIFIGQQSTMSSSSATAYSEGDHHEVAATPACTLSDPNKCGDPSTTVTRIGIAIDKEVLYAAELTPINCNFGIVKAMPEKKQPVSNVVRKERSHSVKRPVVLAYTLRHPACIACRETGQVLSQYVANDPTLSFITIVKEVGVVDAALLEYFTDYGGHNPLYQDRRLGIYKAMGGQKVSVWELLFGLPLVCWRSRRTKVSGNMRETGGVSYESSNKVVSGFFRLSPNVCLWHRMLGLAEQYSYLIEKAS